MATLANAGVLAEKLGVDLRPTEVQTNSKSFQNLELPTTKPCRCVGGPRLFEPDRCHRCGRFLDSAIGELYDDVDQDGFEVFAARIEVERIRVLREFAASGAEDYEAWLTARLYATEKALEKLTAE